VDLVAVSGHVSRGLHEGYKDALFRLVVVLDLEYINLQRLLMLSHLAEHHSTSLKVIRICSVSLAP
jgi:hypothetical protein